MFPVSYRQITNIIVVTLTCFAGTVFAQNNCAFETKGTTVPNTSGTPMVINSDTGTVISANFFDSGAIDPPHFDGQEYVSVCIHEPDSNRITKATITTDVGLDNDTSIKGYPQFVIGTKFGNQYETSFRYYPNTGLPADQQWPLTADNLTGNAVFEFANLAYVSQTKGIGLPAFTNTLPEIIVTLDIDEQNVVGSERDVMLESWFYDTSANADIIGNTTTGQPIVNTLNNIVGIGHPHYSVLDNTLLEMMVHIGPLSPNDVSGATRNPGQNQLTENYSGKDYDGDGIDDHFDVDSHINANTNIEPQPGIYSSGIDENNDGIDDADLLPVTIGNHQYSIWYGASSLSPIIIFSRETNASLQNDFDPTTPDMNLSEEGEIELPWNDFIEYTLGTTLETQLQQLNQIEIVLALADPDFERTLTWMDTGLNPFPIMSSSAGAIGGVELGVEPQINAPSDDPYSATINKFEVSINGNIYGLNDTDAPVVSIDSISDSSNITSISGTATDNVAIDRHRLLIRSLSTGYYWNGSNWTTNWAWFVPNGVETWSYDIPLDDGNYETTAWAWDTSNNIGNIVTDNFIVTRPDTTPPVVSIDPLQPLPSGPVTISGTSSDNTEIDRNRLLVQNTNTGEYWSGSNWTDSWSWFTPTGLIDWSYDIFLPAANYKTIAWTWDTSNNIGDIVSNDFTVFSEADSTPPTTSIDQLSSSSPGMTTLSGESFDNVAIDRNRLLIQNIDTNLFWNGTSWINNWSWVTPTGTDNWQYNISLTTGHYRTIAWTWDTSNNIGNIVTKLFSIEDTSPPTIEIVGPTSDSSVSTGDVFIYLSAFDNVGIDRSRLLIRNIQTNMYWNGNEWVPQWSWFPPSSGTVEAPFEAMSLTESGMYEIIAWTWDTSNNIAQHDSETISVSF